MAAGTSGGTAHVDTFARDRLPAPADWPELLLDGPDTAYPPRLNCAVELVDRAVAEGRGDHVALASPQESLTYAELADRVERIARVLVEELGLVPGNRVLLRAANNPWLVACWLAVARAGGIVVATMPLLRARELAVVLERAQIALALCDGRLVDELAAAQAAAPVLRRIVTFDGTASGGGELDALVARAQPGLPACDTAADDICLIAFTSGTTGIPKGCISFHRDQLAICDTFSRHVVRPTRDDVFIGSPPIAFTFGLGGLVLFPLRARATAVLVEQGAPEALLDHIAAFGATVTFTSPTAYRRMLAVGPGERLRTLRRAVSAGETLPLPDYEAFLAATGVRLIDGIGATELHHIFVSAADDEIRPGATGRPVPGYVAAVLDDDGRELPPGSVGRLAVKGPTGCRYLDDPRQGVYVQGGWNVTGDAYLMDADGYFHFQARTDDMIVSSGYNIAGPEVEEALLEHPAVAECAVVAAPDRDRGMIVKAFVVARPDARPGPDLVRDLQDFVKARIAPYKYPRAVEFIDALPRTETGKVQRFRLREQAATPPRG